MSTTDRSGGAPAYRRLTVRLGLAEHERLRVSAEAADRSKGARLRHIGRDFLAREAERTEETAA